MPNNEYLMSYPHRSSTVYLYIFVTLPLRAVPKHVLMGVDSDMIAGDPGGVCGQYASEQSKYLNRNRTHFS